MMAEDSYRNSVSDLSGSGDDNTRPNARSFLDNPADNLSESSVHYNYKRSRRRIPSGTFVAILTGFFVASGIGWYIHDRFLGTTSPVSGKEVPTLHAENGVVKIRPEDPGGMDAPSRDKIIYNRIDEAAVNGEERLLPPVELPIEPPIPQKNIAHQQQEQQKIITQTSIGTVQPSWTEEQSATPLGSGSQPKNAVTEKQSAVTTGRQLLITSPTPTAQLPKGERQRVAVTTTLPKLGTGKVNKNVTLLPSSPAAFHHPQLKLSQKVSHDRRASLTTRTKSNLREPSLLPSKPQQMKQPTGKVAVTVLNPSRLSEQLVSRQIVKLQLGSFKSAEDAKKAWSHLTNYYGDLIGDVPHSIVLINLGQKGTWHRVYAGPYQDTKIALSVCDALKKRNVECVFTPASRG